MLDGLLKVLALGATAYSAVNNYKQAKSQKKYLKEQNARNARLQQDAFRRARASNLAAMGSSGLRVTGTPALLLQDDEALMSQDMAWQSRANSAAEKQAGYNATGALLGGAAQVYGYGRALE